MDLTFTRRCVYIKIPLESTGNQRTYHQVQANGRKVRTTKRIVSKRGAHASPSNHAYHFQRAHPFSSIYNTIPLPVETAHISHVCNGVVLHHLSSSTLVLHPQLHRRSSSTTPSWCLTPCPQQSFARRSTTRRFPCLAMGRELESLGVPTSVPVKVAHELLQAGHRYLDVRTPEEFSAGHASGAINIPFMYRTGSGMTKNPTFLEEVAAEFGKDDEIIVGCQSGKRSMMAAVDLLSAGFVGVTDMAGGYAAWAQTGLPTEA